MNKLQPLQALVVANTLVYTMYFFFPYLDKFYVDGEKAQLLSLTGYDAIFNLPNLVWQIYFALFLILMIGLFFQRKVAKLIYLPFLLFGYPLVITSGVAVLMAPEMFLISVSCLLDGMLFLTIYFSPTKEEFN